MKKTVFGLIALLLLTTASMNAQVAIGTSEANPVTSAVLDLNSGSNGKLGLLLPRVALTDDKDKTTIPNPATGLLVYATGANEGLEAGVYAWDGTKWQAGGGNAQFPATGVTVFPTVKTFTGAGQYQQLTATVLPQWATNQEVSWSSEPTSVATVSSTGVVTAAYTGAGLASAIVTVTTADGSYTATSTIYVGEVIDVTGVTLNHSGHTFTAVNQTLQLTPTVEPVNATNSSVSYFSSNPTVATVDPVTGLVTAKGVGTATITVTTEDGSKTATCEIAVYIPVSNVQISPAIVPVLTAEGETQQLTPVFTPTNATNQNVTWVSNYPEFAAVDEHTGLVTAVSSGSATITVTTEDGGKTATRAVTVTIPVSGVELNKNELTFIALSATETLVATVLPATAANKAVTWSTSDATVATVDASTGLITAKKRGEAIITVTTTDGNHTATCDVTVSPPVPVSSVSLDKTVIPFDNLEQTETLVATINPENATNQNRTFTSSDVTVATVDPVTGVVTAKKVGIATITVTTENGNRKATSKIYVAKPGDPLVGANGTYDTYWYPTLPAATLWMVNNSKEGTADKTNGVNNYYLQTSQNSACVSPWAIPTNAQWNSLRDYFNTTSAITETIRCMWICGDNLAGVWDDTTNPSAVGIYAAWRTTSANTGVSWFPGNNMNAPSTGYPAARAMTIRCIKN
ncbi:MAG: Ig-like domain-containing protein [Candidatus Symbiothrix sp.]|jgi:uncharacterized protein YjdB|nr:Ig-like domain-containing protein [Candidatus Symbiothrix sp.]